MSDVPGERSEDARDGSGGDDVDRVDEGDAADDERRAADLDEADGADEAGTDDVEADEGDDLEALRERVEEQYDFDDFGPGDMAEMTVEEWEAVFDPDSWITGEALLDRVEADLKARVVSRDVFARVERLSTPDRVVAYSDEGYAVVYENGSVEGEGTVLRDVKPTVALASMDDYDVPEMPDGDLLPRPMEVPEGSGEFGNLMLQVVAGAQLLVGVALLVAAGFLGGGVVAAVAGLGFLFVGVLLFFTVANARLSDKFRAEEYRNRLRAVQGEPPEFLPDSARADDDVPDPDGEDGSAT